MVRAHGDGGHYHGDAGGVPGYRLGDAVIDPARIVFFHPSNLSKFKEAYFNRVDASIQSRGGLIVRGDVEAMRRAVDAGRLPIVGCMPEMTQLIGDWRKAGRIFGYSDRGYLRRIFATWLPRGDAGGFFRWTINGYQMRTIRDMPDDRFRALNIPVSPWQKNGRHIVIAAPTRTYARFHRTESWIADTIDALARVTTRQLVIRDKESKRPLQEDLAGAHALVTHGSISAVEAVVLGTPVFVHPDSAAALVGLTDLKLIEKPVYPDRIPWLRSLAYSQWNEAELVDGTLWRMLT